ncbi:MAG: hypothetical protein Q9214_006041 [Letrouitia sp. 1 TL-2023]
MRSIKSLVSCLGILVNVIETLADPAITLTTRIPRNVCAGPSTSVPPKSQASPATVPHAVLQPAVHWDHDVNDDAHLIPSLTGDLYYSENGTNDPSQSAMVAHMRVNFTVPSVILEHTSLVIDVTCRAGGLAISLASQEVSQQVLQTWTKDPHIQLVTHTASCGDSPSGQRIYFLAETVRLSGSNIIASGHQVNTEQALVDVELVWGVHTPDGSTNSGPSSAFTVTPTSSTSPPAPSVPCGTPTSSLINGLPAAACGPDFDRNLDDALGYYNVDDAHFSDSLTSMAPATAYDSTGDIVDTGKRSLVLLEKRWSLFGAIKSVAKAVTNVVKTVAKVVAPVLPKVVVKAVTTVVNAVVSVVNTQFSPSVHVNVPINVGPAASKLKKSPFGPAYQIYQYTVPSNDPKKSKFEQELEGILDKLLPEDDKPVPGVTFYCVNCGLHGNMQIFGSISFRLLDGITAGSVGMSGNLNAGLQIGVDAFAEFSKTITVARLVHQGLPGFSIPNIITLGPEVTLDMTASFGIQAQGQLLAGVTMSWPNLGATLNILNPSASTSYGFTPQVNRVFDAKGTLTATAALGLPVGLAFGIDLLAGKYSKSIALIDTPAIEAEATFSVAYSNVNGAGSLSINEGTCPGVAWSIGLTNKVELNVLDLRTYQLFNWKSPPLADGCITVDIQYFNKCTIYKLVVSNIPLVFNGAYCVVIGFVE